MAPSDIDYNSREGYRAKKVAAENVLLDSGMAVSILRYSCIQRHRRQPAARVERSPGSSPRTWPTPGPRSWVVRIVRHHYRLDLPADSYSISREVEDVLALAQAIGEAMVIVGHSSGAVVALEALAASPGTFAGAVLFEPPVATGPPDPSGSAALAMANAAVAEGKPGKAAQIFIRDIVGMPALSARMLRLLVPVLPRLRVLIPRQISDLDGVGLRLDAYAEITTPAVLLGGERSPAHLAQSLDALATVMPHAERVTLPRRDHFANRKAPAEVARVIEALARQVLR